MGETRVDLLHLLEDLADAYPGGLEETILTEIVANSLDSGATSISIATDPVAATFVVTDDGRGMRRSDLRRFHDIATSSKERGEGIGFAGVGIKLGLLVSAEVRTESQRGKEHVASSWALAGRKRAPWQWVDPVGLVSERGTAVRLHLHNPLSPLLDDALVERTLRRHFEPLFDPHFDEILSAHYPNGIRFMINGRHAQRTQPEDSDLAPLSVRLGRKRKPAAYGYLVRQSAPLSEDGRGVAVSTYGKVIKRGWDWLGVTPDRPDAIAGLVEAPGLASSLTLNKADFLRAGPRGAVYLSYRKALQEAVSQQLARWGGERDGRERARSRAARPVERDVESVLLDLAESFPMLAMLVERRSGGQRRLPMGLSGDPGAGQPELLPPESGHGEAVVNPTAAPDESTPPIAEPGAQPVAPDESLPPTTAPPDGGGPGPQEAPHAAPLELPTKRGPRRPTRLGLTIRFESLEGDLELGRLVETTVWVNDAHPAYTRAVASRSESYHLALAVAMALAKVAVEPPQEHEFVAAFLGRWGEAAGGGGKDGARRRRLR
ncbi:MAG TPA: ATP-binding protein [Gemmatimonadaceae bacterium]